jgi:hypothetical protein
MKFSLFLERSFQIILILIGVLGGTIFNQLQIVLELIVIILLSTSISKKFTNVELKIGFILLLISVFSFFQNNLTAFALNLKIYLIPFLLLLHYKNSRVDVKVIKLIFILNIFLIIYQIIFNKYIIDVSGFISKSFKDEIENRPLGLFLNFHFSAFFTAICLIYYFSGKSLLSKFFSALLVGISGSFFTLFAFILSLLNKYILLIGAILFVLFYFTFSINEYLFNFSKSGSLITILFQLFDFDRYEVLSFFPQDYSYINDNWHNVVDYNLYISNRIVLENEIQLFTYFIQGGYFFAIAFFFYYLKVIPSFAIFILIAMLHYGYSLTPLIVYMCIVFQNKIKIDSKISYATN